MKLIGFAQLYNELEKGNLHNWMRCMQTLCDVIYIYDQGSTDGSQDYYKQFDNVNVIYSKINNFEKENLCKRALLEWIKTEHSDGWIFWMDGDTVIENKVLQDKTPLMQLLSETPENSFSLGHYNLWRSDTYYRVDNNFHWLDGQVVAFWKLQPLLEFPIGRRNYHDKQYPQPLNINQKMNLALIHKGFTSEFQIFKRYDYYVEKVGKLSWVTRGMNENGLTVERLPEGMLPDFMEPNDVDPRTLPSLWDIYNARTT